ncbi:MAG: hypothetical protein ACRD88_22900 [Terriglobia bacterium]
MKECSRGGSPDDSRNPQEGMTLRSAGLALLCALLASCKDDDPDEVGPLLEVVAASHATLQPTVPADKIPPIGVTWEVGFTENVTLAAMQSMYNNNFFQLSQALWDVTEGQVYLFRVVFRDAVNPGSTSAALEGGSYRGDGLDWVIFPAANWVSPALGFVIFGSVGRTGRVVGAPDNAIPLVFMHESGHFLFNLSWSAPNLVPALEDEYIYLPDDPACIMEANSMTRLCSGGALPSANHVDPQVDSGGVPGQPRSCWEQILID